MRRRTACQDPDTLRVGPRTPGAQPDGSSRAAAHDRHSRWSLSLMDPTIDAMLIVYAAALRRHQQHLEDGCDQWAWHVLAQHLIERAVWSANSTEEAVRDGRPLPWSGTGSSSRSRSTSRSSPTTADETPREPDGLVASRRDGEPSGPQGHSVEQRNPDHLVGVPVVRATEIRAAEFRYPVLGRRASGRRPRPCPWRSGAASS